MNELQTIIQHHFQQYPLMQPQDLVKLLYQNVFGGGHMISDPYASLLRLQTELKTLDSSVPTELFEPIGNGLVRVSLHVVPQGLLTACQLNDLFVASANKQRGSTKQFVAILDTVEEQVCSLQGPLFIHAFQSYLEHYRKAGYPMVSHSDIYRKAYHPAYRVCLSELCK